MKHAALRLLLAAAAVGLFAALPAAAFVSQATTGTQSTTTTLPTWRSFYDWPNGNGYVGWHTNTSSATDYGLQPALGGEYGLWLWAKGGQHVYTQNDYAEWTYTAPGTTRLSSTTLSFSYRNKLLSHHCIDIGYRTLAGEVITHQDFCQPAHPPDSQDLTSVQLTDPSANPTSKVLYLRIHVDCGGAMTCQKTIPQLDPLATGGFVRFLKVDSTLVDDDNPVAQPSGALWDIRDQYVDGTQAYDVTLGATDAGSGIVSSTFTHASTYPPATDTIGTQNAPCDPLHNTLELDARICPQSFSWSTNVATPPYPEGPNAFTESTVDVAGNTGSQSWTIYIDRTAPDSVVPSGPLYDLAGQTTDGQTAEGLTITAHDPGADQQKASGIASVWLEEVGAGVVDSADNPACTDGSCPDTFSADFSVDLTDLADGEHTYVVKASDFVGHVTEGSSWTITVQSPDNAVSTEVDDSGPELAPVDDAPGGGEADYNADADPNQSCDAFSDIGVPDWCSAPEAFGALTPLSAAAPRAATAAASYSGCNLTAVFWSVGSMKTLLSQLVANHVQPGCGNYYFAIDPSKSSPTDPECFTAEARNDWPRNFHAAPVFKWSAWDGYPGGWEAAGRRFRQLMDDSTCQTGDKWFINELPKAWRASVNDRTGASISLETRRKTKANIIAALKGLYLGGSLPDVAGFPAEVVETHNTTNLGRYKGDLENAFGAENPNNVTTLFWTAVSKYTVGWAKESYNRCSQICKAGASARTIADQGVINYTFHEHYLANAAPAAAVYNPVQAAMNSKYLPLMNAVWDNSSLGHPYDSLIPAGQMAGVIREQVYAARRAAASAYGSAGRIGFAWTENYVSTENDAAYAKELAANLAAAIVAAYGPGGTAAEACLNSPDIGSLYHRCPPVARSSADFNTAWNTFKTWY
jgi:hypothetical protein